MIAAVQFRLYSRKAPEGIGFICLVNTPTLRRSTSSISARRFHAARRRTRRSTHSFGGRPPDARGYASTCGPHDPRYATITTCRDAGCQSKTSHRSIVPLDNCLRVSTLSLPRPLARESAHPATRLIESSRKGRHLPTFLGFASSTRSATVTGEHCAAASSENCITYDLKLKQLRRRI